MGSTEVQELENEPTKSQREQKRPADRVRNPAVRKVLNRRHWEAARYLVILHVCTLAEPYFFNSKSFGDLTGISPATMKDFIEDERLPPPSLNFDKWHYGRIIEERLDRQLGYVKTFRDERNYPFYAITDEGHCGRGGFGRGGD